MAKSNARRASLTVTGLDEIEKKLKTLEPKVRNKVLGKALRAGAKVAARAIKQTVPVDTGALKASIKVRAAKRSRKYTRRMLAGPVKGFFQGETFYAGFLEYGTKKMAAKPFVRPAFVASEGAIRATTIAVFTTETGKLLRKK